jgi:DNA-binding transcriptional ArsR family regulator
MDIFIALADPTRRNILEILAHGGKLSASDISSKFKVTAAAISQHLKVLREANLVKMEKKAQMRMYEINVETIEEIDEWTKKLKSKLDAKYDRFDEVLMKEKKKLLK